MNYRKTPKSKRQSYVYTYYEGREKKTVCLNSGEFGVTDQHIAKLHNLDDNEVYNNVKNSHVPFTEKQKQDIQEWLKSHTDEDISSVLFNISFEELNEISKDKDVEEIPTYSEEVPQDVERLREVVEMLSEFDRKIYEFVLLNGMSNSEAAQLLSVTEGTIRYHLKKIITFIKTNF